MAILVTLLLVVGACYSPDLPPRTDGSIDDAAAIADAAELGDDAAIDAPDQQHGLLVVKIEDRGTVTVAGAGSCTDTAPGHTCTFSVLLGVPALLHATPAQDRRFENWTQSCTGNLPDCSVTPQGPMTPVTARFHKEN